MISDSLLLTLLVAAIAICCTDSDDSRRITGVPEDTVLPGDTGGTIDTATGSPTDTGSGGGTGTGGDTGAPGDTGGSTDTGGAGIGRGAVTMGYILSPHGGATNLDALDYSAVTHVIAAFANDQADGSIVEFPEYTALRTNNLVAKAHAQGARVVMSIGGATGSNGWKTFGQNPATTQTFANNVVAKINAENLDGVDLDFEFPYGGNEPDIFLNVITAVHSAVKANNPAHVVMFGVSPGWLIGEYRWSQLSAVSDYAFYFCYDWREPALGPMTNPSGGPFNAFGGVTLTEKSCRAAINYMIAQGYPAEKIVVGFGFYSTWSNPYSAAPAAVRTATPHAEYMEVFVDNQWWLNVAALEMKIDAVMSPAHSVIAGGATVAGIGWWEWGYENPASPDLSAVAKARMSRF